MAYNIIIFEILILRSFWKYNDKIYSTLVIVECYNEYRNYRV